MINTHRQMKDDEARRIAAVDAFKVVKKSIQDLNTKLTEADQGRKSAEAALGVVERQVETQRKQLRQVKAELATTKDQISRH